MPSINLPSTPPPTNQRAEQVALAGVFSNSLDPIWLEPDHCVDPVHAAILRTARLQSRNGTPITAASLAAHLGTVLDEVGGPLYLHELEVLAPMPDAVCEAAAQVRDAWLRRQLIDMGERLQQLGLEAVQDAFGVTSRASGADQALQVHNRVLAAAMDLLRIVISPPATVVQAAEIGCAPDTVLVGVTPAELVALADLNARTAAFSVVATSDRALGLRHSDLHTARANLFRQMAAASALP